MDCCGIIYLNEEGDKMFEPFCRYDNGDKGFGWRGLALAIANHTAKTRGCELSVAINPGRGFVFSPVVPVAVQCAEFLWGKKIEELLQSE